MRNLTFALFIFSFHVHADETKLSFDQTVHVYKPKPAGLGEATAIAPGSTLTLDNDKVYWIEAKGKVPVLVLPQITQKTDGPLKLSLPEVVNWPPQLVNQQMDLKLSALIEDLGKFQAALRTKNIGEAERILSRMENIAQLDYLNFLRASLEFAKGNIDAAKEHVKKGLGRYPANEQGLKFLKAIEGGNR